MTVKQPSQPPLSYTAAAYHVLEESDVVVGRPATAPVMLAIAARDNNGHARQVLVSKVMHPRGHRLEVPWEEAAVIVDGLIARVRELAGGSA